MSKLHIPAPEAEAEAVDRSDVDLAMLVVVFLGLMCAFLSNHFLEQRAIADAQDAAIPGDMPRDVYDELADQRELSQKIAKLSAADLTARDWADDEIPAVMRFGPRDATEVLCAKNADAIRGGTLSKTFRMELEKTLDRRTEFAPWTCMTRIYLAGELPEGSLANEMAQWWGEVARFEDRDRLMTSVVEDLREARERPENPYFYAWLRLCALNFDFSGHGECQKFLAQMAPAQGADLLGVVEKHLDAGARMADLEIIIPALGHLARNGQPHNFKIAETKSVPDYDVDFRQAAVGILCRMMNTPTAAERGAPSPLDGVPELAGEQLSKIALVGARAYEELLLQRWRETCRLAHGGGYDEDREKFTPVPLLAVWDGNPESPADYRLSTAVEWGTCKLREDHPQWWCLADKWDAADQPALDFAARHHFIKTRYMQWESGWSRPLDKPK